MKNLLFIYMLLIGSYTIAQQNELLNSTWYLQEVIVDNMAYEVPEELIAEDGHPVLDFSISEDGMNYTTNVCLHILNGSIQNITDTTLSLTHESETLAQCSFFNQTFENMYFDVMIPNNFDVESNFAYEIIDENNIMTLYLTNSENNLAIYSSEILAVDDLNTNLSRILLYPNPVQEILNVEVENNSNHYNLTLTNLQGQIILNQKISEIQNEYDLSSLQKGVYSLIILDGKEVIRSEKIIKK